MKWLWMLGILVVCAPHAAAAGTTIGTISANIVSPVFVKGDQAMLIYHTKKSAFRIDAKLQVPPGASVAISSDDHVVLARFGSAENLAITNLASVAPTVPDSNGFSHLALKGKLQTSTPIIAGIYTGTLNIMVDYQ